MISFVHARAALTLIATLCFFGAVLSAAWGWVATIELQEYRAIRGLLYVIVFAIIFAFSMALLFNETFI